MSAKKKTETQYRKVTFQMPEEAYVNLAAFCGVTKIDGKVLKPGQMARHLTLQVCPKGAEIRKKLRVA